MKENEIIESLRSFHDISKAINSTLDIDEVVKLILDKTSVLMTTDKVLILLLDRDKMVLSIYRSLGFDEDELKVRSFRDVRLFDHCIVRRGKALGIEDVIQEKDYKELPNAMPVLLNMFFAPLEIKGNALGLIGVLDNKEGVSEIKLEVFCALGSQAAVAIENASLYKRLRDAFLHTAESLAAAIDSRDPYTGGHTRRVEDYSVMLADNLNLSKQGKEELRLAAILHDIGKIGIDDAILRKGGALSEEEDLMMKSHPDIGARILGFVKEMRNIIPGVRYHHERFDGKGYPEGLKGEEIPLYSRIISIADAYDALTTDRPYKKSVDKDTALEEIAKDKGSRFDPFIVDTFYRLMKPERKDREKEV